MESLSPVFSYTWTNNSPRKIKKSILSMDGGGVRGIVAASLLNRIEKRTGEPVCKLFDLVGGTSIGGIMALALTTPDAHGKPMYSAGSLIQLFTERRDELFVPATPVESLQLKLEGNTGAVKAAPAPNINFHGANDSGSSSSAHSDLPYPAKYKDPSPMFRTLFGDALVSDSLTDVLVTYATMKEVTWTIGTRLLHDVLHVIKTIGGGWVQQPRMDYSATHAVTRATVMTFSQLRSGVLTKTWTDEAPFDSSAEGVVPTVATVATMTSAAPTYFPVIPADRLPIPENSGYIVDGGLARNRPEALCVEHVKRIHRVAESEIFVLSIATGSGMNRPFETIGEGLVVASMNVDAKVAEYQSKRCRASVARFNVQFPNYVLDLDAPVHDVKRLHAAVEAYLDSPDGQDLVNTVSDFLLEIKRHKDADRRIVEYLLQAYLNYTESLCIKG